ncbi:MAG: HEPN domain-containing protein, partial [Candidatus Eremiobacteraeota bacterium]|nr:HEPN domain-containing protein [Candidatus Eremiobacteraeota bacterium]
AEQDLEAARELASRMPNVACFHAQQCSQKALKAVLVAVAGDVARSHLSDRLLGEARELKIDIPAEVVDDAQALDKFYITPRYPDALGGSDIRTAFKNDEALGAIERAERVVTFAGEAISAERG